MWLQSCSMNVFYIDLVSPFLCHRRVFSNVLLSPLLSTQECWFFIIFFLRVVHRVSDASFNPDASRNVTLTVRGRCWTSNACPCGQDTQMNCPARSSASIAYHLPVTSKRSYTLGITPMLLTVLFSLSVNWDAIWGNSCIERFVSHRLMWRLITRSRGNESYSRLIYGRPRFVIFDELLMIRNEAVQHSGRGRILCRGKVFLFGNVVKVVS